MRETHTRAELHQSSDLKEGEVGVGEEEKLKEKETRVSVTLVQGGRLQWLTGPRATW